MSWLSRLLGGRSDAESKPKRVDYLTEALALERRGDFDAALTSYRLALRDAPDDAGILQNMAIVYSRTNRPDDAIRCYRRALAADPHQPGAHYGLAFLLLKREDREGAADHLRAFLGEPPQGEGAEKHIQHASETLRRLESPDGDDATAGN